MPGEIPRQGDIYRVSLDGTGHVLRGPHYAVVVSDDPFNYLSTVVVVPLSTGAKPASFRPELLLHGKKTLALTDQIRAIDKRRLKEFQENVAGTSFFLALMNALIDLLALSEHFS
ncbi:MAG: type II toxin-antitoxin system PemK/MazF family toxin [Thermoanaerobacteraceae bacterium]|nr:type II toxin-antitoxin system PemK/MazF family toxin [Thermoanaerobacteraceae bacterium]